MFDIMYSNRAIKTVDTKNILISIQEFFLLLLFPAVFFCFKVIFFPRYLKEKSSYLPTHF